MKTYTFEGIVTAVTSICHNGGESLGIETKLRREKFVQPDGTVEDIPVISGNGMRGLLRDRGMLHLCRSLGYGIDDASGEVLGLQLSAFYFLFSGGALTASASEGIDIDRARQLKSTIPLVGIFGGAVGNMIMPGKLKVGKLIPMCAETKHLLPQRWTEGRAMPSIWDFLQREMYTRKDDEKNEHLRPVIDQGVRALLDAPESRGLTKKEAGGDAKQQMMYYIETFAAGTPFYWKLQLDDVTDVEFEAFILALLEFNRKPYIGGKSGTGMGEVRIQFDDNWKELNEVEVKTKDVGLPIGRLYQEHLQTQGVAIRKLLQDM
jgi:CRISPR type IV-associated protein Csf2